MIDAARRGEFDYYQKGRKLGGERFIPTPDAVIRAMLVAALAHLHDDPVPEPRKRLVAGLSEAPLGRTTGIVTAKKPALRRR